ncbi:MAG: hypothetical protein EZS28_035015, partial [Streblomastix strix]
QELARQTHFRGYYLLNADIVNLPASSTGDFAFSAESGTVWMYESEWYDSGQLVPDQVTPASDELPIINGTAAAGNSTSYSRGDHVHPQQLTYDNDITATKFIKTGGTNQQILLANGDTTTIDSKLSRSYNTSAGGWIRLCVFPAGASVGNPFIEFKIYSQYNAVQTVRLVPYYTVNGINSISGIFTAPTRTSTNYVIEQGVNELFHTHTGSGTSAIYSAYVRIQSTNSIVIVVSDQSTYYTNRITEILTQDVVSIVSSATQIPISYDLGNGGIINNMIQVNPTGRSYTTYNNGIRIGNNSNYSALYLGCATSAINTTQAGQWEINKTDDNTLNINPSSLRQADHSVGLSINSDSTKITFNSNELVNVGTDQTITGIKTFGKLLQVNPSLDGTFNEGIRISRHPNSQWSNIQFGSDPNSNTGYIDNQWLVGTSSSGAYNPLGFTIVKAGQENQADRGLMISADGNTLTFNGSVIAGTGATSGASNGSVNYSAGNPILWGVNSADTNGGFYSNGTNICWRARPITLGSIPP